MKQENFGGLLGDLKIALLLELGKIFSQDAGGNFKSLNKYAADLRGYAFHTQLLIDWLEIKAKAKGRCARPGDAQKLTRIESKLKKFLKKELGRGGKAA